MHTHYRLNSAPLVVLLQQWTGAACGHMPPPHDVAEQLSQGLSAVDAIALNRALRAIETLPPSSMRPKTAISPQALDAAFGQVKAAITGLITSPAAPAKALRARADHTPASEPAPQELAEFPPHGHRYLAVQKQMDGQLAALRAQLRQSLSQSSPALRQLAALDAVLEQMLGGREQRLWTLLPTYLEKRMEQRHQAHHAALQTSGQADDPTQWRQPGGWLWAFDQDMQALLLAEMQLRLQPLMGLLEAARNADTQHKEPPE